MVRDGSACVGDLRALDEVLRRRCRHIVDLGRVAVSVSNTCIHRVESFHKSVRQVQVVGFEELQKAVPPAIRDVP